MKTKTMQSCTSNSFNMRRWIRSCHKKKKGNKSLNPNSL